jgi:release factor glutamine methyltransferase
MVELFNVADPALPIESLLAHGRRQLDGHSQTVRLDTELLLACVLRRPRSYLVARAEEIPSLAERTHYLELLQRRAQGEPLAYLSGEREFWSLPLAVTVDVLIPRPETELVVERALALRTNEVSRVADLGTGSGAIALALAHERTAWDLIATDRSAAALRVAQANAQRLGASRVTFVQGDWLEALPGQPCHLIVSNPPYVAASDPHLADLRFEPLLALAPGPTGLEALHTIIARAGTHLLPQAWLVLEHGADQRDSVSRALVAAGFTRVRSYADLAGHDRVTEAQWPHAPLAAS